MNRWLIPTLLIVSAVLVSSASASPTTHPDGTNPKSDQPKPNIHFHVNGKSFELKEIPDLSLKSLGNLDLKQIPDLSAYLNGSANVPQNGVNLPDNLNGHGGIVIIPGNSEPKFDPTANLHMPESELREGMLNPSGPSYMFNGVKVYVEPVAFAPQAACTQTTAARK
jgi:hypothetical protein